VWINEIYYSLQGEGLLTGVPSIFVRLAGCPLRCRWCDTKYAWQRTAGVETSIERIVQQIGRWSSRFVVVTGGEPMVEPELPELLRRLKASGYHITVETAGLAYIPQLPCDLMSISPKLSNSDPEDPELAARHARRRLDLAVLRELVEHHAYQLKFVVESEEDLSEVERTIEQIANVDRSRVMLMPQASNRDEFLSRAPLVAELCKRSGLRFCHRLQILLWDNARGT